MTRTTIRATIVAIFAASAGPALAHVGHEMTGLASGLAHPIAGADHLLAMTAVGLWAGVIGGRLAWLPPAGFLLGAVAGGVMGLAGAGGAFVEAGTLVSVIALGAFAAAALRAPGAAILGIAAAFGAAHGAAHGSEVPAAAAGAFLGGALVSTALLHAAGAAAALALSRLRLGGLARLLGGAAAVGGGVLAAG
jgi:urease accessory protein